MLLLLLLLWLIGWILETRETLAWLKNQFRKVIDFFILSEMMIFDKNRSIYDFCCCCFVHFSWSWPLNTSRVWIVHLWPGCDAATFNEIPLTCGVECTPHRIKCEHFIMRRRTIRRRNPIHIRWTEWHLAGWLAGRWSVVVVMAALRAKKPRYLIKAFHWLDNSPPIGTQRRPSIKHLNIVMCTLHITYSHRIIDLVKYLSLPTKRPTKRPTTTVGWSFVKHLPLLHVFHSSHHTHEP